MRQLPRLSSYIFLFFITENSHKFGVFRIFGSATGASPCLISDPGYRPGWPGRPADDPMWMPKRVFGILLNQFM